MKERACKLLHRGEHNSLRVSEVNETQRGMFEAASAVLSGGSSPADIRGQASGQADCSRDGAYQAYFLVRS